MRGNDDKRSKVSSGDYDKHDLTIDIINHRKEQ